MVRVKGMYQKDLKNRSSKHLIKFTGPGTKPVLWSWSNAALKDASKKMSDAKWNPYEAELNRRSKNATKRKTPRPAAKSNAEVK